MCDNIGQSQSIDARFVFAPVLATWDKLAAHNSTPWVQVKADSSKVTRFVAPIANFAKKTLIYAAYAIGTIAAALFSIITLPSRASNRLQQSLDACQIDLNRLSPSERKAVEAEITQYIKEHGTNLTPEQKIEFTHKIMVYYARSNKIYGPVSRAWTEYLLDKANAKGMKLVFLARDGIPQYKMALKLMKSPEYQKKYPNLVGDKQITLGYLSRKVVTSSQKDEDKKKLFQEYAENDLGIKKGDKCLFADVGFLGSMIKPIRELLPDAEINFEYLISMTDQATGFIASKDNSLHSVPTNVINGAGGNKGVHWLEDTHQGNLKSPETLVKVAGHVYPNTSNPLHKELASSRDSLPYMLRKFSQKAIVRCYADQPVKGTQLDQMRSQFDETIGKIKHSVLPLFLAH